jgi:predicted flap endonuclease-1-like 5' DNA nuclease
VQARQLAQFLNRSLGQFGRHRTSLHTQASDLQTVDAVGLAPQTPRRQNESAWANHRNSRNLKDIEGIGVRCMNPVEPRERSD